MATGGTGQGQAPGLVMGDLLWAFQAAGFKTREQVADFLKIALPVVNAQILTHKAERIRQRADQRRAQDEAEVIEINQQAAAFQDQVRGMAETAKPIG